MKDIETDEEVVNLKKHLEGAEIKLSSTNESDMVTDQEQAVTKNMDLKVGCEENNMTNENDEEVVKLKNLVMEAEKHFEEAEVNVATKKEKLKKLQLKLQDDVIKNVTQLKSPIEKSDISRKWRVLGMKVRVVGLGMAVVKRRNVNDAETFIVKETEVRKLIVY